MRGGMKLQRGGELQERVENELKKFKCRICAQGHSGNVTKGIHYFNTFAVAPNCATTRLMHAISAVRKLVVVNYDIVTAYLWP